MTSHDHDHLRLALLEQVVDALLEAEMLDEERLVDAVLAQCEEGLDDERLRAGMHAELGQQVRHARRQRERARAMRAGSEAAAARARAQGAIAREELDRAYRALAEIRRHELADAALSGAVRTRPST